MIGKLIDMFYAIILLIIIIFCNLKDFINLWKGRTDSYIQMYSGLLFTFVCLVHFVYEYNLVKIRFLIYGFYLIVYTVIYYTIKSERDNNYE